MKEDGVVGFVPSPVNLETILIRREVQARKAAKALAKYVQHARPSTSFDAEQSYSTISQKLPGVLDLLIRNNSTLSVLHSHFSKASTQVAADMNAKKYTPPSQGQCPSWKLCQKIVRSHIVATPMID